MTTSPLIRSKEEQEWQALEALVEHGSARKAAAVLYCDRRTVRRRALNLLKRIKEARNVPRGAILEQ